MLTIVVIANGLIGLACLFVAWQIWQIRRQLIKVAETLDAAERSVHNVLHNAPHYIYKGQTGTNTLRNKYSQLEPQVQRLQQVMGILGLGQLLIRRRSLLKFKRSGSRRHSNSKQA